MKNIKAIIYVVGMLLLYETVMLVIAMTTDFLNAHTVFSWILGTLFWIGVIWYKTRDKES